MGEHDLAALATMLLVFGLATSLSRDRRPPAVALVGIGVGTIGIVLGASLASVLGLYIGAAAMVGLALTRRDLRRRAVVVTLAICVAVTAGTLACEAQISAFYEPGSGRRRRRPASTRRAGVRG